MNDIGFCTNAKCPRAERREPVELYPGPGQYCPDCGQLLRSSATPQAPAQALREGSRKPPFAMAALIASLAIIVAGAIAVPRAAALGVRVCDSSMTARIVHDIVLTYTSQHNVWPYHYTVTRPGDDACDVRFAVAQSGSDDSVIARDGVVAIVNPQNTIARLDLAQLRGVLAGQIVDWSQLGGPRGPIVPVVPEDGSDEAAAVTAKLMFGRPFGPRDVRVPAGAEITRLISSPRGIRAIGIVPFSVATPAKVLALGHAPAPSPLSIANDRYPLAVRLLAESDFRSPRAPASALLAFSYSADANALLARTALVTRNGP
jgi:hypothetical protein